MSVYLWPARGLRLRISRRGLRAGLGPRWLRVWTGPGGDGVSTGAGPVTAYRPARRARLRDKDAELLAVLDEAGVGTYARAELARHPRRKAKHR
jgi:hypothetical protein